MRLLNPPRSFLLLAPPIPVRPSEAFLNSVRDALDAACRFFDDLDEDEKVDAYKLLGWYVCWRGWPEEVHPDWARMRKYFQG